MGVLDDAAEEGAPIPVMTPLLPSAERVLPYLRRIDSVRVYTNYGPLVLELEHRLAAELSLPVAGLASASSGTAALVAAILATAGEATRARPLALMPSYTFVATALAAEQCGYQPWLADIDPQGWMLDPEQLLQHPELDRVGVVVPVAPYGMAVPQAPWREFCRRTGIPVVIDGAASFEAARAAPWRNLGEIPVVMSFHATKSFGMGEGGCAATTDLVLATRIATALNFGFNNARSCSMRSINGKLSEFHAAVGLAELDGWEAKAAAFGTVAATYRRYADAAGIGTRLIVAPLACSSYVLFYCDDAEHSARVQASLDANRIGHRLWYGGGLHRHPHLADLPRDELRVTERVAPCILGLPAAPDLAERDIARVVAALVDGMERDLHPDNALRDMA